MPLLTRGTNALFDAFSAPAPAFALEADLSGAWARRRGALLQAGGGGGGVAWPGGAGGGEGGGGGGSGGGSGNEVADFARALVFGALARPLGCGSFEEDELVGDNCLRVLVASCPGEARAVACSALSAVAGPHHRHLLPGASSRLARAVRSALAASSAGDGTDPDDPGRRGAVAAASALLRQVRSGSLAPANLELASAMFDALVESFDSLLDWGSAAPPPPPPSVHPSLHLLQAGLVASLRLLPELGRARATGSVAGLHPAADAAAASAGALARRALLVRRDDGGDGAAAAATAASPSASAPPRPLSLPRAWLLVVEPCGRDLVRALQDGAASGGSPELERVWRALLAGELPGDRVGPGGGGATGFGDPSPGASPVLSPAPLSPSSPSLSTPAAPADPLSDPLGRILATRTPPRLLLSRLPPDAESSLYFMLTSVRFANHRRYQQWYTQRHVLRDSAGNAGGGAPLDGASAAASADAAVVDAARYVVGVLHLEPSAEERLRASDVFPRWAALGWLLSAPRTPAGAAGVRAAAMLDWVFFNPPGTTAAAATMTGRRNDPSSSSLLPPVQGADSLRSIEPAANCALKSLPRYAQITNGLLEFAALAAEHLSPRHASTLAARGLAAGADALVARRAVASLERLATALEIPPALRERVAAMFPGHCGGGLARQPRPQPPQPPQPRPPPTASTPTWSDASDFPAQDQQQRGPSPSSEAEVSAAAAPSAKRPRSPSAEAARAAATTTTGKEAADEERPKPAPAAAAAPAPDAALEKPETKRRKVDGDGGEEKQQQQEEEAPPAAAAAAPSPPPPEKRKKAAAAKRKRNESDDDEAAAAAAVAPFSSPSAPLWVDGAVAALRGAIASAAKEGNENGASRLALISACSEALRSVLRASEDAAAEAARKEGGEKGSAAPSSSKRAAAGKRRRNKSPPPTTAKAAAASAADAAAEAVAGVVRAAAAESASGALSLRWSGGGGGVEGDGRPLRLPHATPRTLCGALLLASAAAAAEAAKEAARREEEEGRESPPGSGDDEGDGEGEDRPSLATAAASVLGKLRSARECCDVGWRALAHACWLVERAEEAEGREGEEEEDAREKKEGKKRASPPSKTSKARLEAEDAASAAVATFHLHASLIRHDLAALEEDVAAALACEGPLRFARSARPLLCGFTAADADGDPPPPSIMRVLCAAESAVGRPREKGDEGSGGESRNKRKRGDEEEEDEEDDDDGGMESAVASGRAAAAFALADDDGDDEDEDEDQRRRRRQADAAERAKAAVSFASAVSSSSWREAPHAAALAWSLLRAQLGASSPGSPPDADVLGPAVGVALLRAAGRVGLLVEDDDGESDDDDEARALRFSSSSRLLPKREAVELLKSLPPSEKLVRAALKLPASEVGEELALALLKRWGDEEGGEGEKMTSARKSGGSSPSETASARALAAAAVKKASIASPSSTSRRGSRKRAASVGEAWGV